MYNFVRQQLELDRKIDGQVQVTEAGEIQPGQEPSSKRYTSHKCKSTIYEKDVLTQHANTVENSLGAS